MGSSTRNIVTLSHMDTDLEEWCKGEAEKRSQTGPKVAWSSIANELVRLGMETYLAEAQLDKQAA